MNVLVRIHIHLVVFSSADFSSSLSLSLAVPTYHYLSIYPFTKLYGKLGADLPTDLLTTYLWPMTMSPSLAVGTKSLSRSLSCISLCLSLVSVSVQTPCGVLSWYTVPGWPAAARWQLGSQPS